MPWKEELYAGSADAEKEKIIQRIKKFSKERSDAAGGRIIRWSCDF